MAFASCENCHSMQLVLWLITTQTVMCRSAMYKYCYNSLFTHFQPRSPSSCHSSPVPSQVEFLPVGITNKMFIRWLLMILFSLAQNGKSQVFVSQQTSIMYLLFMRYFSFLRLMCDMGQFNAQCVSPGD